MGRESLALILWVVLLLSQFGVNAYWFEYWHGNVELTYTAEIKQCNNLMDNYNDQKSDLINYERATTDKISANNFNELSECRKLLANPDRFLKGRYGEFWALFFMVNGIMFGLYSIISFMIGNDFI